MSQPILCNVLLIMWQKLCFMYMSYQSDHNKMHNCAWWVVLVLIKCHTNLAKRSIKYNDGVIIWNIFFILRYIIAVLCLHLFFYNDVPGYIHLIYVYTYLSHTFVWFLRGMCNFKVTWSVTQDKVLCHNFLKCILIGINFCLKHCKKMQWSLFSTPTFAHSNVHTYISNITLEADSSVTPSSILFGLYNPSNVCYINSVLQVILHLIQDNPWDIFNDN